MYRAPALALVCAAMAASGGCTVGPDFQPPVVAAPANWGPEPRDVPSRSVDSEPDPYWWRSFRDRELDSLVERLAAQNLDLKTAAERVIQGVAQTRVAESQGVPHIEGQSIENYNRASTTGFAALFVPAPGATPEYRLFQEGLQSSWELDLFGKVRRAVEAQEANTLASVENRHGIALAALAELAQAYFLLRGTQVLLRIAERDLQVAVDDVTLVETRFRNGTATTLDLAQARSQKETIAQTLPPLRVQEAQLINAIGLLLGEPPRALADELRPARAIAFIRHRVPVGVPGTLVRRRPDIREAEVRLHAATAETGVAIADLYPDVTLNGNLNVQSLNLSTLFIPQSLQWTVGPTVTIPIFEGGRLRGNLELRESQQQEAGIAFQQTLLRAWQEVDNSLTAYAEAQRRRAAIARAVAQNRIAVDAARQRYVEGLVDFLNVNTTLAQLLQSENELADADTQIAVNLVNLYRALGGGWQIVDPPGCDCGGEERDLIANPGSAPRISAHD
jgi:NodT family efflux transporter outer membrane factor (OMF) lipoprotein